jgi:AraC-like DNA-binding protein
VTTDQSDFQSSTQTVPQGMHAWNTFEHEPPPIGLSFPARPTHATPTRPAADSTARRSVLGIRQPRSMTEQLFASAHEDIARLNEILRSQACTAILRGADGVTLPLDARADAGLPRLRETSALCAPVYGADGRPLASIEVVHGDADRSSASGKLLCALLESSARSIAERWFRVLHRRQWIIAAMRRNAPSTYVLLAFDQDQRLKGADRNARQLLEASGLRLESPLGFSALFQPIPGLFRRRSYRDVATTLLSAGSCQPWIALITPPDAGAGDPGSDGQSALQARPRLDSLAHSAAVAANASAQRGLSAGALRRIEEYVDTHLESPLETRELAAIVRMSSSHFTRSFHKTVGLTPHRYVIRYRVMRARELLATTELPLTEIAMTLGFSDQSHFSRRFHEWVGMPPGAFRCEGRL